MGPHMRRHKKPPPPPPPPKGFGGGGSSSPNSNQPGPQGHWPPPDPSVFPALLGFLSNLMGGRKDPAEEAFREAYVKFIKAVADLPASIALGTQGALRESAKAYVKEELKEVRGKVGEALKEAVREAVREEVEEELGKFFEALRAEAAGKRSPEGGGEKVEG